MLVEFKLFLDKLRPIVEEEKSRAETFFGKSYEHQIEDALDIYKENDPRLLDLLKEILPLFPDTDFFINRSYSGGLFFKTLLFKSILPTIFARYGVMDFVNMTWRLERLDKLEKALQENDLQQLNDMLF